MTEPLVAEDRTEAARTSQPTSGCVIAAVVVAVFIGLIVVLLLGVGMLAWFMPRGRPAKMKMAPPPHVEAPFVEDVEEIAGPLVPRLADDAVHEEPSKTKPAAEARGEGPRPRRPSPGKADRFPPTERENAMNQRTICVFVLAAGLSGCPGKNDEKGVSIDHRDRAIAANTAAIRLDPTDTEAYRNRGLGYALKGEYDRAIADYTEAIRLDPRYAAAYYARGSTYHTLGEHDKAIADYTETIRLDPKNEIHGADAHTFRGVIYCEMGDLDKGISDYDEPIRLDPEYADAYHYRGIAFKKRGEQAKAKADFAKAKELGYEPE